MENIIENTSGQGKTAMVPGQIDRWNWGAFLLNWIWGIGNKTYIAFLMFVPLVNIVMALMLGLKGSAWAWRNKRWDSVEQFRVVQRKWAYWALGLYAAMIALSVGLFFAVTALMAKSPAYTAAVERLQANEDVVRIVGQPMSFGSPSGGINSSGPSGSAELRFSVEGPAGSGTAFVEASERMGAWQIDGMVFEDAASGDRLSLTQ
ncbi:cytochrome c oxidase assembly factor Coa1 family protein [Denitromonas sp.]|uniref:cytochrome c oxidase assembly factor Coa1 family protein n=1 Tax=Denitromonas sp. TaxID=2734609 RepID=UPI002AFF54B7|nr:cytochrome c oxidase assembly factor Coa1 family protein [Denitromonas sp.]